VNAGQSVSFTVAATGTAPLTYQWQKQVSGSWSNVGTNSATFTINSAATSDAGSYRVVVSNSAGSATSNTATLTVKVVAPSVTSNPTSQAVTAGQTVTFTVAGSGSPPPTVQWQVRASGSSKFANIAGATATTYSFAAPISASGNQYRAVFTNSAGSATS